jgi:hypothetical protein
MPLLPRRATGQRAWWLDVAVSIAALGTAQALVVLGVTVLDSGRGDTNGLGSEAALVLELAPGGSGPGDLLEPLGVTLEGSVSGLYPGARVELTLAVRNPSQVELRLDELLIAVGAPDRDGCTADAILVGGALTSGAGKVDLATTIPPDGATTLRVPVGMDRDAPSACQGATFPLSYLAAGTLP